MVIEIRTFYKVVILNIDIYESTVADERHFGSKEEAEHYANTHKSEGQVTVIVQM